MIFYGTTLGTTPKILDPNFVRTTVYLPKLLHRQLKSALLAVWSGNELPCRKVFSSISRCAFKMRISEVETQ